MKALQKEAASIADEVPISDCIAASSTFATAVTTVTRWYLPQCISMPGCGDS